VRTIAGENKKVIESYDKLVKDSTTKKEKEKQKDEKKGLQEQGKVIEPEKESSYCDYGEVVSDGKRRIFFHGELYEVGHDVPGFGILAGWTSNKITFRTVGGIVIKFRGREDQKVAVIATR